MGSTALAGAMTGVLAHTFAAALGLSALIAASARLYDALRIAGALYLLWLAYEALRHGSALKLDARERARSEPREDLFHRRADQPDQSEDHPVLRDLPAAVHRGRRSRGVAKILLARRSASC